jgi:hypothetical protein
VGSPASAVLRGTPIPCCPSHRASLSFARRFHPRPSFAPPGGGRIAPRPGLFSGFPNRFWGGGDRASQVPGDLLLVACSALRPRWDLRARPLPRFGAAFRSEYGVCSHHSPFGAQSHSPLPRCLRFAAWVTPSPRKTRFRLAASFAGQGLNLQGSSVRFLRSPISSLPPHPGFAWRTLSSVRRACRLPPGVLPGHGEPLALVWRAFPRPPCPLTPTLAQVVSALPAWEATARSPGRAPYPQGFGGLPCRWVLVAALPRPEHGALSRWGAS